MRKLVCKWLDLVPLEQYTELYRAYGVQIQDTIRLIEKHQAQSAWEQVKRERKQGSIH